MFMSDEIRMKIEKLKAETVLAGEYVSRSMGAPELVQLLGEVHSALSGLLEQDDHYIQGLDDMADDRLEELSVAVDAAVGRRGL